MKNTAANLNVISIDETEAKLLKMKELDHQMKVLKASFDKLKEEVLNSYFVNNEEFVGSEGLVLATYKSEIHLCRQSSKKTTQTHISFTVQTKPSMFSYSRNKRISGPSGRFLLSNGRNCRYHPVS